MWRTNLSHSSHTHITQLHIRSMLYSVLCSCEMHLLFHTRRIILKWKSKIIGNVKYCLNVSTSLYLLTFSDRGLLLQSVYTTRDVPCLAVKQQKGEELPVEETAVAWDRVHVVSVLVSCPDVQRGRGRLGTRLTSQLLFRTKLPIL